MQLGGMCVVKNQDDYVYYAIKSVLPYVDRMVVFVNDGNDRTYQEAMRAGAEVYKKTGQLADLRNEAADMLNCDWVWWFDGDEVWPQESAMKVRDVVSSYDKDLDTSILSVKLVRFVDDRFHWDGQTHAMPRIYRHKDVKMYGKGFPACVDALARREEDLEIVYGETHNEARVPQPYIKDVDLLYYHYAECNTLLQRKQKWYGYISSSNDDGFAKNFKRLQQQRWGIEHQSRAWQGPQPEVFG